MKKAFTFVEIMIVVFIISILLVIAVPNFIKARQTSQAKTCVANLREIYRAKDQWSLEQKKGLDDTPTQADLMFYLKKWPECPSGGEYSIGAVGRDPTCSVSQLHHL